MYSQLKFHPGISILFFIAFSTFLCCENPVEKIQPENLYGKIVLDIGIKLTIVQEKGRAAEVSPEELAVDIMKASGEVYLTFERYGDMPPEIPVEPGSYYVVARSAGEPLIGFDSPYYRGESDVFSIDYEETVGVDILATLENCMVSIIYSQNVIEQFTDYSTVVSSIDGNLTFSGDETRAGYFPLSALSIISTLHYLKDDGTSGSKEVEGSIPDPLSQTHYEVHVDAQVNDGTLSLNVNIDPSVTVEIIELDDQSQAIIEGPVAYGDIIVTEIMYNPAALSDSEGEWFEIYNASDAAIDLYHLVVKKGTEIQFIIEENINLDSRQYAVLAKHVNATSAAVYIYGSSMSLLNTGDEIVLSNYGDTGSNGSVICSVNYGDPGFPDGNGASLNLDLNSHDVSLAGDGTNWCLSTTAYETGDLGTPGTVNESCN